MSVSERGRGRSLYHTTYIRPQASRTRSTCWLAVLLALVIALFLSTYVAMENRSGGALFKTFSNQLPTLETVPPGQQLSLSDSTKAEKELTKGIKITTDDDYKEDNTGQLKVKEAKASPTNVSVKVYGQTTIEENGKQLSSSKHVANKSEATQKNSKKTGAKNESKSKYEKDKKKKKKRKRYDAPLLEIEPDWGFHGELRHIEVLPTKKPPLKKDRRVVFPNITLSAPVRSMEPPSGVPGIPRELIKANAILRSHPFLEDMQYSSSVAEKDIEAVMYYLKNTPYCSDKPIFLTMATVGDDLYWQLIENFIYTMVKFNTVHCAFVICVSDPRCMQMCAASLFPCYNYQEKIRPLPSVMEQIAQVKLNHIPKALNRGVDTFMLDLDVGFLADPMHMVRAFYRTPIVDIMVQVKSVCMLIYA